jgi:uncharacterized membrane protein YgcG
MAINDLVNDQLTNNTLDIGVGTGAPKIWVPIRTLVPLAPIVQTNKVNSTLANITPKPKGTITTGGSGQTGTAPQVVNLSISQEPIIVQGKTMCLVIVTFNVNPIDQNFAGARVWFESAGYLARVTVPEEHWSLMADGDSSPIMFIVETTNSTVKVRVQSWDTNGNYSNFENAPTKVVTLNGVITAPPAPTISQFLVGTPTGFQFTFDEVVLPTGTQDVIDSYRVYRHANNSSFSGASVVHTFKHDPTNTGAIVFSDTINDSTGVFYYYWATSVDTKGLESTPAAANASGLGVIGSIGSIPVTLSTPFKSALTSSSVTWKTSPSCFFTRADGSKTTIGQTSTACTSLRASIGYYFFPYWDEPTQALKFVTAADCSIPTITGVSFTSGSSQWIQTASAISLSAAFSIEFWFKGNAAALTALASLSAPQGTGSVTSPVIQILQTSTGEIEFGVYTGSAWDTVTTAGAATDDGAWHHVVCTWDGSTAINVWVDSANTSDGTNFWTQSCSAIASSSAYWHFNFVGGYAGAPATSNTYGTDLLSNIAYYPSCLDVTQVGAHFQAFVNLAESIYEQEVGYDSAANYWELDETSGTTAADSIGSNNGTYEASPTLNQTSAVVTVEGSPAIAFPFITIIALQQQTLRNRVPLSPTGMTATTTASGSKSGSGGGSGNGGGGYSGGGGGDKGGCFSGNTLVRASRGDIAIKDWQDGNFVLTAKGTWRPAVLVVHDAEPRTMHRMGFTDELVTFEHHVLRDRWVRAGEVFSETREHNDKVYTLCVVTGEPVGLAFSPRTEHSFTLTSGLVVHNIMPTK